jgi:hypothetical protein
MILCLANYFFYFVGKGEKTLLIALGVALHLVFCSSNFDFHMLKEKKKIKK